MGKSCLMIEKKAIDFNMIPLSRQYKKINCTNTERESFLMERKAKYSKEVKLKAIKV